jgi:hypothetical protein
MSANAIRELQAWTLTQKIQRTVNRVFPVAAERIRLERHSMTSSAQRIAVFAPLIIGLPVILGTIVIHGVAVATIVHFFRYQRRLGHAGVRF